MDWYIGKNGRYYDRLEQLDVLVERAYYDDLPKDPEEYWQAVGTVWKRTEFPYHNVEAWYEIFSKTPGPNQFTKDWLQNPKTVYRGYDKKYENVDCDWSWSTDKNQADWFAQRFEILGNSPSVKQFDTAKDKARVWCVFEDDPESEVLLWSPMAYNIAMYGIESILEDEEDADLDFV